MVRSESPLWLRIKASIRAHNGGRKHFKPLRECAKRLISQNERAAKDLYGLRKSWL